MIGNNLAETDSNPEISLARAEIIRASAGSGKTYVLVQRYIALLLMGESARTILASTFTVRAAGEIRERILRRLAQAVLDENVLADMQREYGRKISFAQISSLLRKTVREFPASVICTLDSLVARVAGGLTLECELPLGWRTAELPGLSRDLERELVALQAKQIGKLLSMIVNSDASRRIAEPLIDACLSFHQQLQTHGPKILAIGEVQLLPDNKNWRALADALEQMPLPLTKAKTQRAFFAKACTRIKTQLLQGDPSGLFDLAIIERALLRTEFDRESISSNTYEPLWQIAEALKIYEKNRIIERNQILLLVLASFDELYRKHQALTGLVTHSDLLLAVARYMTKQQQLQDLSSVAYALDQRFSHVLLDEFQDTSPLQWQVLKPFVAELVSDSARSRTVFIVGDPKQAIYGWRGGSAAIFDEVTSSLICDWNERELAVSYRSTKPILDFVNQIFHNLNPIKSEFTPVAERFWNAFKPHTTIKTETGRVTVTLAEEPCGTWMITKLKEIFKSDPNAEVGILTRKNSTVVEIIRALRHAGIAAVGDGRAGSERTLIVESVKSLLHLSLHPSDSAARFFVEQSGLIFADETLEKVLSECTTPLLIGRLIKIVHSAACTAEQLRDLELALIALSGGIERGADARELIAILQNQPLAGGSGQVSVMTMHRAKGLEFQYVLLPELDQKLIRNVPPQALSWTEPDFSMRTIPYVNETLQTVDERFVAADAKMQQEEAFEALCLMYVALTRAVKELHLCSIIKTTSSEAKNNSDKNSGETAAEHPFTMFGLIAASLQLAPVAQAATDTQGTEIVIYDSCIAV